MCLEASDASILKYKVEEKLKEQYNFRVKGRISVVGQFLRIFIYTCDGLVKGKWLPAGL